MAAVTFVLKVSHPEATPASSKTQTESFQTHSKISFSSHPTSMGKHIVFLNYYLLAQILKILANGQSMKQLLSAEAISREIHRKNTY